MLVIGSVLIFLGFTCAGLLAGIFWVLASIRHLSEEQLATTKQHDREIQLLANHLATQLRTAAIDYRNDLRLAGRLPPLQVPGEAPADEADDVPTPRSPTTLTTTRTRSRCNLPPPQSAPRMLHEDKAPPSGWTPEQILNGARSEGAETMSASAGLRKGAIVDPSTLIALLIQNASERDGAPFAVCCTDTNDDTGRRFASALHRVSPTRLDPSTFASKEHQKATHWCRTAPLRSLAAVATEVLGAEIGTAVETAHAEGLVPVVLVMDGTAVVAAFARPVPRAS